MIDVDCLIGLPAPESAKNGNASGMGMPRSRRRTSRGTETETKTKAEQQRAPKGEKGQNGVARVQEMAIRQCKSNGI